MARDTGPPTSPFLSRLRGGEAKGEKNVRPVVCKAQKARLAETGGPSPSRFLPDARSVFRPPLFPPSHPLIPPPSGSSIAAQLVLERPPRCPLLELLYYAAFWGQRTFVTAAAIIIGTVGERYV